MCPTRTIDTIPSKLEHTVIAVDKSLETTAKPSKATLANSSSQGQPLIAECPKRKTNNNNQNNQNDTSNNNNSNNKHNNDNHSIKLKSRLRGLDSSLGNKKTRSNNNNNNNNDDNNNSNSNKNNNNNRATDC
ncbi:unnamed protein product [Polarella glacialis]|uniref:Uncharacterized protein n=1 Tax=Polarella glacialis TaxID=89957 RepID=A0A813I6I5_POLGL|nr:unnamed protein product [Polarella glacialis]